MDKTKLSYLEALKQNSDSAFYCNLIGFLTARLNELTEELIDEVDSNLYRNTQGKAQELRSILQDLQRKRVVVDPVDSYDG